MQVNFNGKENQFKVPHYKVVDEVLAFSHISGKFFVGTVSAVNSYADTNQSVVNYTIVFDNKDDAREWVKALDMELYNF